MLDTSALAKVYHQERGSEFLDWLLHRERTGLFLSRLGMLEMHSVVSGKLRSGETTREASELARRRFRSDVRNSRFKIVVPRLRHYEIAETLLAAYGTTHGLRSLDSLQLAVALDLRRDGVVESFVASDKILIRVALLESLPVINPETANLPNIF
ncbi:MAG: type II toxin-antitoxin system VapC family toxin [Bryobacteraceae bacterium]